MIVYNLACTQDHRFDGWFRSADDFDRQSSQGLVECPLCGDKHITKQLSAPRLNVSGGMASAPSNEGDNQPTDVIAASMLPDLQTHMMAQFKQFLMANTENVGRNFAETARKMHYGEEAHRNIRGRVSPEESMALRDEGIETVSLPPGILLDEGLQS